MKTRILVEIEHDRPFKAMLVADLPYKLERCAFDYIQARGADLRDVSAHVVKEAAIAMQQPEAPAVNGDAA